MRNSWSLRNSEIFGSLKLPRLESLDLENNYLCDRHWVKMISALPSQLQSLNLSLNGLKSKSLATIFQRKWPNLRQLNLDFNHLEGLVKSGQKIEFPKEIEVLRLSNVNLSADGISRIQFPRKLRVLDLSENPLGKEAQSPTNLVLPKEIQFLDLSHTGVSGKFLAALLTDLYVGGSRVSKINELRLKRNGLSDEELDPIFSKGLRFQRLDLSYNRLGNATLTRLAHHGTKQFYELALGGNLFSEDGLVSLLSQLDQSKQAALERLDLSSLEIGDLSAIGSRIPKSVKELDLSGNVLSDWDLENLAPELPQALVSLNLGNSGVSGVGIAHLEGKLPRTLKKLFLEGLDLKGSSLLHLFRALPNGLRELHVGRVELRQAEAPELGQLWPQGLLELTLTGGVESGAPKFSDAGLLFDQFPASLLNFYFWGLPVSKATARQMAQHWPRNVKEWKFSGDFEEGAATPLFQSLPESSEQLVFTGKNQLNPQVIHDLLGRKLPNVRMLKIGGAASEGLSGEDLKNLVNHLGHLNEFSLIGVNAGSARSRLDSILSGLGGIQPDKLRDVRLFIFTNNKPDKRSLLDLIAKLPEETWLVYLAGLGISPDWVDPLLKVLPANLSNLNLSGNNLGRSGVEKVRKFTEGRTSETGNAVELIAN